MKLQKKNIKKKNKIIIDPTPGLFINNKITFEDIRDQQNITQIIHFD